jgi:alpha-L-fucosidase
MDREWGDGAASPQIQSRTIRSDHRMRAVQAAGAKYVGLHHDGFCLWPGTSRLRREEQPWENGWAMWCGGFQTRRESWHEIGVYLSRDRHEPATAIPPV